MGLGYNRFVAFSYSVSLTERDNGKFRDLLVSQKFQRMWGHRFNLRKIGETKVTNDKTGSKLATSFGGVGTGERGDRVILDDPHNVKEGESEKVRGETVRWFRESLSNRLNDAEKSAIVVIMQRVHEADVSGTIISEGMGYTHLMIPMEFDLTRACVTSIGWEDPRTEDRELAWPDRFSVNAVHDLKRDLGPYAYAAQYDQFPKPRGGGIIKDEWWQLWPSETYPQCEFVLASLDTAYTEKKENDASALTVWGVFRDKTGNPKLLLAYAWEGRLEVNDLVRSVSAVCSVDKRSSSEMTAVLAMLNRGSVETEAVPRFPVDKLLIENKANGISVAQEMGRLYGQTGNFGVELVDPTKWGDKVARLYAVQHLFADEMIFAPDLQFAELVINQVSSFPKAAHDDLVDSTSLALGYLRRTGLLLRREEHNRVTTDEAMWRSRERPLY